MGTKTEIKNKNSFRALQRALTYEVERQIGVLEDGGRIVQETRAWDEGQGVTLFLRTREEAHDYRYFPEPDLVPLVIDLAWVEEIRTRLPELPGTRVARYVEKLGLSAYDAGVLTAAKTLADYFEACLALYPEAKAVANWIMGDLSHLLNAAGQSVDQGRVVKEKGLSQISDEKVLLDVIRPVLAANGKVVADFRSGKDRALGFLVGQVMKKTRGQANPDAINRLLREALREQG